VFKIAAFDLDGTLIVTQSGRKIPVNEKDWKFFSNEVTTYIDELSDSGFKIVIFSNQIGVGRNIINENVFKKKVEDVLRVLKVPVQIFVSTQHDIYRKPAPGMWNIFTSEVRLFLIIHNVLN